MADEITNRSDYIDVRDVIERFEELEDELTEVKDGQSEQAEAMDLADWIEEADATNHPYQDAIEEYESLKGLLDDLRGEGGDHKWKGDWYPVTLIRDSYFEDFAEETAYDIGAIDRNANWPLSCINWTEAASQLQQDYSMVDFGGVDYWYR